MIATIAAATGLGPRVVKIALIILALVAVVAAFYAVLDAYGDSRYEAGEAHADEKWKEAEQAYLKRLAAAEGEASANATERARIQALEVEAEKEKLDEAVAHGTSPLDVLFPVAD